MIIWIRNDENKAKKIGSYATQQSSNGKEFFNFHSNIHDSSYINVATCYRDKRYHFDISGKSNRPQQSLLEFRRLAQKSYETIKTRFIRNGKMKEKNVYKYLLDTWNKNSWYCTLLLILSVVTSYRWWNWDV